MTDTFNPFIKIEAKTYPAASDSMSGAIIGSMNQLSQDVSPLTRWRLRKVRGAEAVKLAETALAEYMAAKRRVFIYQVGLTEDHAKKVMLAKSIDDTATIEKEIARIIGETVRNFETLITGQEEAAYRAEIAKVK